MYLCSKNQFSGRVVQKVLNKINKLQKNYKKSDANTLALGHTVQWKKWPQKRYIKEIFDFKDIPILSCKTNAQIVGDLQSMMKTVHHYFETAAVPQKRWPKNQPKKPNF
jgi:hypothetical protein